jgi:lantibiotic modifying enzyme
MFLYARVNKHVHYGRYVNDDTHEHLVWELLNQIDNQVVIDKGLLDSIGRTIATPMAKWLVSEYSESGKEFQAKWLKKASTFLLGLNNNLNKQKQSLADELSANSINCSVKDFELVGDYHGEKRSTLRCTIGADKMFVKPERHYQTGDIYDSFLDIIDSNLPRCKERLLMRGSDFILEKRIQNDATTIDYCRFGEFATICFFLGLVDLHASNVIFQHGIPVLVDPECILNPPGFGRLEIDAESLGVLSLYRCGLFGHTRHMRGAGVVSSIEITDNWLEFSAGVKLATEKIVKNIDSIESFFSHKREIITRRLPRETSFYFKAIQDCWHPLIMTEEVRLEDIFSRYYSLPPEHPFLKIRNYEQASLERGEIPLFTANAVTGKMEFDDSNREVLKEIPCEELISTNISILRQNGSEYLLNSLKLSLGITDLLVKGQADSCINALHQRLKSSIIELPSKKVFIDIHLEPDGPAGIKAIGPGMMNGAGGIILTLSDLEFHDLIRPLAEYALTTGLKVREDGGYGLFFGPLSGFFCLSLIADKYTFLKKMLNENLSNVLEVHSNLSSNKRFSDLSHGVVGSVLILNYLKNLSWLSRQNLIEAALNSERGKLEFSIKTMLKSKFKGVMHGCESLCYIWDEIEMNCPELSDRIIAKVEIGINEAAKESSHNWCNGMMGIPLAQWSKFSKLKVVCDEGWTIKQKMCEELESDFTHFETWFPCHGEIIATSFKQQKIPYNSTGYTELLTIKSPISLSYGTGLSGVISTYMGHKSWLIRSLEHLST